MFAKDQTVLTLPNHMRELYMTQWQFFLARDVLVNVQQLAL